MSTPVKVSTYNWIGLAYLSAISEIPTSAIPDNYFTSGAVSGSTEQKYVYFLSGTNYPT